MARVPSYRLVTGVGCPSKGIVRGPLAVCIIRGEASIMARIPTGIMTLDPGLTDISDEQLACMAEGHDWPKLRLNQVAPKGFRAVRNNDGSFLWVYTCNLCTTTRSRDTLRYGIYDHQAAYSYTYPKWWIHFKADDDMTRARLKRELSKRLHDAIEKSA